MDSYQALKGYYKIWMKSSETLEGGYKMGKYKREMKE